MIYAVIEEGDESRFKIGYTTSPNDAVDVDCVRRRVAGATTFQPRILVLVAATPGNQAEEEKLHQEFAPHRHRREWFNASDAVLAWVNQWRLESPIALERDRQRGVVITSLAIATATVIESTRPTGRPACIACGGNARDCCPTPRLVYLKPYEYVWRGKIRSSDWEAPHKWNCNCDNCLKSRIEKPISKPSKAVIELEAMRAEAKRLREQAIQSTKPPRCGRRPQQVRNENAATSLTGWMRARGHSL